MGALSNTEQEADERAAAEPLLAQVEAWAAVNSGTRNLDGLQAVAGLLADTFAVLPGEVRMVEAAPVRLVDPDGNVREAAHGANLHLAVRPQAPVQLLLTGHMDTVFAADHPFQALSWIEPDKVLGGPGVADMKGGIAVMLAALKAIEVSPERGARSEERRVGKEGRSAWALAER